MSKKSLTVGLDKTTEQVLPSSNFCDLGILAFYFSERSHPQQRGTSSGFILIMKISTSGSSYFAWQAEQGSDKARLAF